MGVLSAVFIDFIVQIEIISILISIGLLLPRRNRYILLCLAFPYTVYQTMNICVAGGSTIPLGILLFLCIAYFCKKHENNWTPKISAIVGTLAGLGVMNRFDFLPIAVIALIGQFFVGRQKRIRNVVAFLIPFVITISPWIIYSEIHFNQIFVTDNSRRLWNVSDTRPSSFFTENNASETIWTDFTGWLNASLDRWAGAFWGVKDALIQYLGVIIAGAYALFFVMKNDPMPKCTFQGIGNYLKNNKTRFWVLLMALGQMGACILTGYRGMARYYTLSSFTIAYALCCCLGSSMITKENFKKVGSLFLVLLAFQYGPLLWKNAYTAGSYYINDTTSFVYSQITLTHHTEAVDYLQKKGNARLIIDSREKSISVPYFAAFCRVPCIIKATNLIPENAKEFVEFFDMNYLYSSTPETIELFSSEVELIPTGIQNLYEIKRDD